MVTAWPKRKLSARRPGAGAARSFGRQAEDAVNGAERRLELGGACETLSPGGDPGAVNRSAMMVRDEFDVGTGRSVAFSGLSIRGPPAVRRTV